jgi:NADPH oxidase 1
MINDAGAMVDPLTGLQSRTHYGRPNWRVMFTGMRDGIERGTYIRGLTGMESKVGVYFCGPSALAKTLKRECQNASSEFVKCTHLRPICLTSSYFVEGTFLKMM